MHTARIGAPPTISADTPSSFRLVNGCFSAHTEASETRLMRALDVSTSKYGRRPWHLCSVCSKQAEMFAGICQLR